jgi:gamma-glutamyltranspeptidase/glutathione hydrolase
MQANGGWEIPLDHPAVVTVPGCVDGLLTLSRELGTKALGEVLQPALALAGEGFEVSVEQSRAFDGQRATYGANPAVSSFYPGGEPVRPGDIVRRPDLATVIDELATTGDRESFYLGPPGEDIVAAVGGLISRADLERDQAEWVEPMGVDVFGLTAWTTPPNSQGYLGPATLKVFEMLDAPDDPESPRWWHLLIEAYRCLAWERDDIVADPESAPLPPPLMVDSERLERLAATVTEKAGAWPSTMGPVSGTAYMCVTDHYGMAVSVIQSNYRGIGSRFGAARSGFVLQDRGSGFTLMPGHPNQLGPGKRPLHTLSPTLWTRGTEPVWLIGTRGGSIQPQLVAQMAARIVGHGADPAEAQREPRWAIADFGPASTSQLGVEPGVDESVLADLARRGHAIEVLPQPQSGWGPLSVIGLDGPIPQAAADPRVATSSALVIDVTA